MARKRTSKAAVISLMAVAALSFACTSTVVDNSTEYAPGLGEIMTLTQMRHAKLWLAAKAGNWALADYEVDELEEGFADAIAFHPTHKSSPVPIAQVIPIMTSGPIVALREAIEAKDDRKFTQAFDSLTTACNACHDATNFGFNVVTTPKSSSFLNQDFSPPK